MYSVNFIDHRKNVVWARVIMVQTVIYLLMVQKLSNLKQKILESFALNLIISVQLLHVHYA